MLWNVVLCRASELEDEYASLRSCLSDMTENLAGKDEQLSAFIKEQERDKVKVFLPRIRQLLYAGQ